MIHVRLYWFRLSRPYSNHGIHPRLNLYLSWLARLNQANIQLLPDRLQTAVFPDASRVKPVDTQLVALAQAHLRRNQLPIDGKRAEFEDVKFDLPPLEGRDVEEHFWALGARLGHDHRQLVEDWVSSPAQLDRFEAGYFKWDTSAVGWTEYDLTTGRALGTIQHPPTGQMLVFDVETAEAFHQHKAPLIAIAMSKDRLFAWISPQFLQSDDSEFSRDSMIRFGAAANASLLVGHNVSYDRARVYEEYEFEARSGRRFLDTLSLHSAVGGISSQQRITWTKYKKERDAPVVEEREEESQEYGEWCRKGSMANLVDTVRLHCNGLAVDKAPRDLLMSCTDLTKLKDNLPVLLDYCCNDVAATASLFRALWPKFLAKCPHPVTFGALLEMSIMYLPVDGSWPGYIDRCEAMLGEAKGKIEEGLASLAKRRMEEHAIDDQWMSRLDWTPTPARYTKARFLKDGSGYAKGGEPRPIGNPALFGMPAWYKTVYDVKSGRAELTTRARLVPYLLKMCWQGNPVHFIASAGWCYGIKDSDSTDDNYFEDETAPGWKFYRIPHSKEQGANVGCLLSKDYLAAFEKGVLSVPEDSQEIVKGLLYLNSRFSFWTGYRERVRDQLVVWDEEISGSDDNGRRGAILPQCISMGTVTRRSVESTWVTASNPKANLVGSELKAMIRAPPGWSIVGADVDSQELWIASLLGDAQFGFAGATAVSWMTLQGTKADGTDLHSKTAALLGMSRDAAKIFTYGRIYGAGAKYAAQLLQKYDSTLDAKAAADKARLLYHATKGRRRTLDEVSFYAGGSESFMFNQLEEIARAQVSRTPALGAAISDALLSSSVQEDYLTSRINWAVQSSGVDYLHMLLVAMSYLLKRHAIPARLLLTIHDEVRYLVPDAEKHRLAACLQIANLWTRAMFVHRLGMCELPLSVAFFAAVDFDKVLRKEPGITCVTPSNSEAIPPGCSLDIHGLLSVTGEDGALGPVDPCFSRWWRTKGLQCRQARALPPALPTQQHPIKQLELQADISLSKVKKEPPSSPGTSNAAPEASTTRSTSSAATKASTTRSSSEARTMNAWKTLTGITKKTLPPT